VIHAPRRFAAYPSPRASLACSPTRGERGACRAAQLCTCIFIAATFSRPGYAFSFPRRGVARCLAQSPFRCPRALRDPRRAPSRRATSSDIRPPSARLLTSGTGHATCMTSPDDLRVTAQVGGAGTPEAGTRLPGAGVRAYREFRIRDQPICPHAFLGRRTPSHRHDASRKRPSNGRGGWSVSEVRGAGISFAEHDNEHHGKTNAFALSFIEGGLELQ
jgi:hypothetical protein